MILPVRRDRRGLETSEVSMTASPVGLGIAVQNLFPETAPGDPCPVILPQDRGEVTDDQKEIARILPLPEKNDNTSLPVVKVYPFKPFHLKIKFIQGWLNSIKMIQISHPFLDSLEGDTGEDASPNLTH